MSKKGRRLKDVKAERAEKRRKAKRRKRIIFLVIEIVVLLILLLVGYAMTQYGKMQTSLVDTEDIAINEGVKQEGYMTIALFGGDSREGELEAGTHADTIMIASIDNETKEVKIISVYRDFTMQQENGTIKKANSAYFVGGPQAAINMLNKNLDLDIQKYVTVDFKALADVIDLLGGVEVEISDAEAKEMNHHMLETARAVGRDEIHVSEGKQVLDGVQAVTYARIRKNVGGDYARTDRQRLVIQKVVEKVKGVDLKTINAIIDEVFPQVSTNFTLSELVKMAAGVMKYELGETSGFPFERIDGRIDGVGSVVVPLGFKENVEELHTFLYPKDDYAVSQTVIDIANEIEYLSGYTRADYQPPDDAVQSDE